MYFFQLQAKEIINMTDGRRLGVVVDLDIEPESGKIKSLIVRKRFSLRNRKDGKEEYVIPWSGILKIGEDVLFVRLNDGGKRKI
ncbi:MAG: YlmC/YmxH family sporulation protein [Caldibacillus debilis]|jgi:YlmC/YmxH family sporulation protein|uniref:Sporulation protein, YlmC/YmxH family n=2 Tax=Caldibacillus debilis TaxID=301148 RepID=A0A420VJS3_9BACI|nr:YlmC/YmxH family sporulation protein [Caldibacillus debilis]MBO2480498.1 YlmC/YmxH family sporulation protein [Bacillaceae bacterium]KYD13215.1 hypothetical protein B4135_2962 [Caldibacillus debilis]MBY6273236.1 YlmC/YmxH family sporulation protein [Bacillaceae bacterium]OUM85590.1 MAG: hypothetical protein BAA03_13830 [Caldibacillus debilis]REJ13771.1 MAG: YlmC/YmxH family sporulation protein [Caldibacillus debilis]